MNHWGPMGNVPSASVFEQGAENVGLSPKPA